MNIGNASNFEELLEQQGHETPYLFERMFSTEDRKAKKLSKKRFKLLRKLDAAIRPMLREGEGVYFLTSGLQTSIAEQQFIGMLMYYINRRAFVFTTERVLLIQIDGKDNPLPLRAQIEYSAIDTIKVNLLGTCTIKFKSGEKTVFTKIPKRDAKFMNEMASLIQANPDLIKRAATGREDLCPHCFQVIEGFPSACPHCEGSFKSPNKATWLSLLFPGLGDWYLGQHRAFAVMEILFALFLWSGLFLPGPESPAGSDLRSLVFVGAFLFIVVHGLDALVTRHIARKGVYPDRAS